jgi:hypothetical protein
LIFWALTATLREAQFFSVRPPSIASSAFSSKNFRFSGEAGLSGKKRGRARSARSPHRELSGRKNDKRSGKFSVSEDSGH